ncbi:hypothetical protein [Roseivirga seohaensis]|uniref:hypothetical protein n=1 Tax=Roseivirga seohaensis TaxID=1914963 RepID=UPI003BAC2DDD
MKQIISTKAWQLFVLLLVAFIGSNELIANGLELVDIPLGILAFFLLFYWYLAVGLFFYNKSEDKDNNLRTLFVFNCLFLFLYFGYSYMFQEKTEVLSFEETPPYVLVVVVYFVFAYFQMLYFISKHIISFLGEDVVNKKFRGALPLFFLLLFAPIAIWFIQPLLNESYR